MNKIEIFYYGVAVLGIFFSVYYPILWKKLKKDSVDSQKSLKYILIFTGNSILVCAVVALVGFKELEIIMDEITIMNISQVLGISVGWGYLVKKIEEFVFKVG